MMNACIIILKFSNPSFLPFFELLSRFDENSHQMNENILGGCLRFIL